MIAAPPPARIEVSFRHERHDWLRMRVRAQGARPVYVRREGEPSAKHPRRRKLSLRLSSVFCPFPDLIAWLEAMAAGVQECAFEWDAEGPMGRLEWECPFLSITWRDQGRTYALQIRGERRQVVAAFYQAFRGFMESSAYDPLRYEELRNGDRLVLMLRNELTEDELIGQLLERDAAAAEAKLAAIWPIGPTALNPEALPWIDPGWRQWDTARRRAYLKEVFALGGPDWFGTNLRALRSEYVERWLAE